MDKKQLKEFEILAKSMIEFLSKNGHPHMQVIVDSEHAELVEGSYVISLREKSPYNSGELPKDKYHG